jgi:hypothetical protein
MLACEECASGPQIAEATGLAAHIPFAASSPAWARKASSSRCLSAPAKPGPTRPAPGAATLSTVSRRSHGPQSRGRPGLDQQKLKRKSELDIEEERSSWKSVWLSSSVQIVQESFSLPPPLRGVWYVLSAIRQAKRLLETNRAAQPNLAPCG